MKWTAAILSVFGVSLAAAGDFKADMPKTRKFTLRYEASIEGPEKGTPIRVWLPEPQSTEDQEVTVLERKVPAPVATNLEPTFGNQIAHFESKMPDSGPLTFGVTYRIERDEVLGLPGERSGQATPLSEAERKLHLSPNKKIPLNGKSQLLLSGITLPSDKLELARLFYNRVDEHVKYDKSRPGYGTGDSEWVCDSRFGNCTDFHSLFIAWSRANQLPARFEIGFPIPEKQGQGEISGYHCWAFFHVEGHGWIPVDISEADKNPAMKDYYFGRLTADRVTFSRGRDIHLVPRQSGEPLNFFIFPYAEANGKALPKEQVKLKVTFKDE